VKTELIEAGLLRCPTFDVLEVNVRDGRQTRVHNYVAETSTCTSFGVYNVTEADVRNLIKQLTEIADKTWPEIPKCPTCGQEVVVK
jgi:predicted Fe-Mo cluster-binding NifX family protein